MKHINTYLGFVNESNDLGLSKEATTFLDRHLKMNPFSVSDLALANFAESWSWNPETRRVDVKGTVSINTTDRIPPDLKFGVVTHNFNLHSDNPKNAELGSADFTPREPVENMNISNSHLKTLKGCTPIIKGSFICDSNELTSLEGSPQSVGQMFSSDNNKLSSLKGITPVIGYNLQISYDRRLDPGYNGIETLKGGPTSIKFNAHVDGIYIDNGLWGKREGWVKAFKELLGIDRMDPVELEYWFNDDPESFESIDIETLFDEDGESAYEGVPAEIIRQIPNRAKKIGMLMEMMAPGEAERILDDSIKENPLKIDLLDELPEVKAGVLKRTGLKDLSVVARNLRGGAI
jgi:hypothetical protein